MNRNRQIFRYGDQVFARLLVNGKNFMEFMVDKVSDMSDLLKVVRRVTKTKCCGLVKLYVRNLSRGWSMERTLVLDAGIHTDSLNHLQEATVKPDDRKRYVQLAFNWRQ